MAGFLVWDGAVMCLAVFASWCSQAKALGRH